MPTSASNLKIVGLDLSLTGTGVAILRLSSGKWAKPELHTVRPRPCPKGPVTRTYEAERLHDVVSTLREMRIFEDTSLVGIEDYAYGIGAGKTNCIFELGELGGCVRYLLIEHGISFIEIPITVGKKWATGNGSAKKPQVAEQMSALWSLPKFDESQYDSSDALALGSAAAHRLLGDLSGKKLYQFQGKLANELEIVSARKNR